ncbi:hypothetical protein Clacol_003355 [Clathrus columnatus]|uniref:Uncharacterized protein n=1 Tax=Clathrus columnatus TaxID=1419009 RepID=A0AAV5A914_9AGAM|nr:hypothetical protein Clacol_003355 [Clathrus columnatus]
MSQTKASKIIKAFHNNDLYSSTLKAILENDEKLFLGGVRKANLKVEDLILSDVEYQDLVKGVKPSGELDIVTWEGYYETSMGPKTDPLAFLILSTTENIYWGSRSQILRSPREYGVEYSLTSDGKLNISTPKNGNVSITFTRIYDDSKATAKASVSGECNGESFSGVQVIPSLRRVASSFIDPSTCPSLPTTITDDSISTEDDSEGDVGTYSMSWQDVCLILGTGIAILTFIGLIYQTKLWVNEVEEKRKARAKKLRDRFEEPEGKVSIVVVTEERANKLQVKFDNAWTTITRDITSQVHHELNSIDFDKQTAEQIVSNLRETAKKEAKESLERYVRVKIGTKVIELLDPWHELPSYQEIKNLAMTDSINEHVQPKLRDIENEPAPYDNLTRSLTLKARERAFSKKYDAIDKESNEATKAYKKAKEQRENTEKEIEDVKKNIENEKDPEEKKKQEDRKNQLEEDLKNKKTTEDDKNKERVKAEKEKKEAADKSHEAEKDVKNDKSKDKWNEKGKHIFK